MSEPQIMKVKICLIGEHAVGKTSLIRRYVLNEFDDRYITTLGAKVSKKEFDLMLDDSGPIHLDMTIWDIMGSKGFRELLREAYFHGAQGVLAVCDVTRAETLSDLDAWVESVFRTINEIPVVFAINKFDLPNHAFSEKEVRQATEAFDAKFFYTSAKTGENVEKVFHELAKIVLNKFTGRKILAR